MPRVRRGVTLLELMVAIVIGGLALGLVSAVSVRQQRVFSDLADAAAMGGQLRDAAAILPIDLRAASAVAGDVRSGEARDTSIELRSTIASGVGCDTSSGHVLLAPPTGGAGTFGSVAVAIQAGDTAWVFTPMDTGDVWRPYRVASATGAAAGQCSPLGPHLSDSAVATAGRIALSLDSPPALAALIGTPVRVTRPFRYSLYRASDGAWYLGARDWNTASSRFNTIQPVSGPFLSAASGGLAFTYIDSAGRAIPTPVADTRAVALVGIAVRAQTRLAPRALAAATSTGGHRDSAVISVMLRNRR